MLQGEDLDLLPPQLAYHLVHLLVQLSVGLFDDVVLGLHCLVLTVEQPHRPFFLFEFFF